MAEPKNRWTWDLPGFEPRRSTEVGEERRSRPRRLSVSQSSLTPRLDSSKKPIAVRLQKLEEQVKHTRDCYLELKREATDLKEYSHAKLDRVMRYLGVLEDRARKLDQAAFESEAILIPLINEKKKVFNDLLTAKGNVKVYCRVRPPFEDEGPSIIELPDEFTVRINTSDDSLANPKKDYEFDRVYGPHVGQGEFFCDVQPFVQSALDGYNVSIFAYGQSGSGKTHTMVFSFHWTLLISLLLSFNFLLIHFEISVAVCIEFVMTPTICGHPFGLLVYVLVNCFLIKYDFFNTFFASRENNLRLDFLYTFFALKGSLDLTVRLLLCDLEVTSLNHGNSLLQSRVRLHMIDSSPEPRITGALYIELPFYILCKSFYTYIQSLYTKFLIT